MVMRPGPPYALVSIFGVGTYALLVEFADAQRAVASIVAIAITFAGRVITFRLGVHTRAARSDLSTALLTRSRTGSDER